MSDIRNPRLLWIKFGLFLVLGLLSLGIAIARFPSFELSLLVIIVIWAFCRAYYFAFYVIEHHIDRTYRFTGLASLIRCALRNRKDADSPG